MQGSTVDIAGRIVMNLVPMLLSLSVHEFSHAFAADRLGDDTPRRQGRLTLSPLAHYDLVGTILVPIVAVVVGGFAFIGWARPVEFVPAKFDRRVNMRTGTMITAVAGPLSNLALAVISIGLLSALPGLGGRWAAVTELLQVMFLLNIGLCIFNFIPLPPLDGSHLWPRSMDALKASIAPYSFLVLILLLNIDPIRRILFEFPLRLVAGMLQTLFSTRVLVLT